jgi:hypothetical protein
LLEDLFQNSIDQFSCILIAVQSVQQQEAYKHCFNKWLQKNKGPVVTQESIQKPPGATTDTDSQVGAGGRPVTIPEPRIDGVTLEGWLIPSKVDEDPTEVLVIQDPDEIGQPWNEYPEALMEHPLQLKNTILQKLCRELHMLAKLTKAWDQMVEKRNWVQLQDRGLHGQCRESNHNKVCESWDPTEENSLPIFMKSAGLLPCSTEPLWIGQHKRVEISISGCQPTMIGQL